MHKAGPQNHCTLPQLPVQKNSNGAVGSGRRAPGRTQSTSASGLHPAFPCQARSPTRHATPPSWAASSTGKATLAKPWCRHYGGRPAAGWPFPAQASSVASHTFSGYAAESFSRSALALGPTSFTSCCAPKLMPRLQPHGRPTARASIHKRTWPSLRACCKPMPTPGSTPYSKTARFRKPPAEPTRGENSTICTRRGQRR